MVPGLVLVGVWDMGCSRNRVKPHEFIATQQTYAELETPSLRCSTALRCTGDA
jgi:hypothetical protein